jgi:3-hydroxybutyryl-CoA dehydrogenase
VWSSIPPALFSKTILAPYPCSTHPPPFCRKALASELKAEFAANLRQPYRLRPQAGAAYGLPDFRDRGCGMDIAKVGVVGAGQMGNGIAHVFALAGYDVLMTDVSKDALDKARQIISGNLDRQVSREKITADERDEAMARIDTTVVLKDLGQCDLIIEAATERETVKTAIFEDLVPHLKPETILTSNTSSISITRLASRTDRPEKFMGFHFMNPVPVMQLVELIRGIATDEETYQTLHAVVERLGKTSATAEDFPAFIVNRILMPMINEAVYTLYEGVGSVQSIDQAMKLGTNHPMGPLELADFIGLDTCLAIMNVLHDGLADTKYRPCPLLTKYVEAGWLGRKTERGFYDYRGEVPVPTR